ncbi:MAG: type II toxin-antitoxin system VapC family toxin [Caulobacteraceae bacterium]|nr:type II toxin-antitoxin system VapC family toxin [Caulobacteraceae bacterium]
MLAIDTNLVVRFLTGDHRSQSAKVKALIARETVFVATTVLLEVEWVLRSVYKFGAPKIQDRLTAFIGLPNVVLEDAARVAAALDAMAGGLDFADALHLAAAENCEAFLSFDRGLAKAAAAMGGIPVRAP